MNKKRKRIFSLLCALLLIVTHCLPLIPVSHAQEAKELFSGFEEIIPDARSMTWEKELSPDKRTALYTLILNSEKAEEQENRIAFYATEAIDAELKQQEGMEPELRIVEDPANPGKTREEKVITLDTETWQLTPGIDRITYNETTKVFEVTILPTKTEERITLPTPLFEGRDYGLIALEAAGEVWNKAVVEHKSTTTLVVERDPESSTEEPIRVDLPEAPVISEHLFIEMTTPIITYLQATALEKPEEEILLPEALTIEEIPKTETAAPVPEISDSPEAPTTIQEPAEPTPIGEELTPVVEEPVPVTETPVMIEESEKPASEEVVVQSPETVSEPVASEPITSEPVASEPTAPLLERPSLVFPEATPESETPPLSEPAPLLRTSLTPLSTLAVPDVLMAPMAVTNPDGSVTESGSGNLTKNGSYSWTATANAAGNSINWSVTINTNPSIPTTRAYIRLDIPSGWTLTGGLAGITGTSTVGGFTVTQQADGSYRAYQNTTVGASTMTISYTTTLPSSTTIPSYSMQILPYLRETAASPYNGYGPFNSSTGSVTQLEAALTKITATIPNPAYAPYVNFTVNKTGANNAPLAGATFTLTNGPTGNIPAVTTNAQGVATFSNILAGTYTLTETVVPAGYNGTQPQTVNISTTNTAITVPNTLIPTSTPVTVKATVDGTTTPLAGVHFKLIQGATEYTAGPTDAQGNVTFPDIPYGSYTLRQSTTPAGYYAPSDQTVNVSATVHNFAMQSTTIPPMGTVNIEIRDHENQTLPVVGAVVHVVSDATGTVYERTTDGSGNISLADLPVGEYTITQESAPTGYTKYPDPIKIDLKMGETQTVRFTNLSTDNPSGLGRIVVNSYEMPIGSGIRVPGAVYEVSNDLGDTWTGTTDANGYLVFTGLPIIGRTYTLRQVSVPYEYSDMPTPVVEEGIVFDALTAHTYEFDVYNSKRDNILLNVNVLETGDSTIPIAGAQIEVTRPADGAKFYGVTDANGYVSWMLPSGDYEVRQLTTDGTHLISTNVEPADLQRPFTAVFYNNLQNPALSTKDVTVHKAWGDPPPSATTDVEMIIVADGAETTTKHTMATTADGGSYTFYGLPKYNANHMQIQYSVKETAIEGYYAVYTKNKADGTEWTVTNYTGEAIGNCANPELWVADSENAYKVSNTGAILYQFPLNSPSSPDGSDPNHRATDIAVMPDSSYMFGIKNSYRPDPRYPWLNWEYPLVVYNPVLGTSLAEYNLEGIQPMEGLNIFNSLHTDGTYIYAKAFLDNTIYVYEVADIIDLNDPAKPLILANRATVPLYTTIAFNNPSGGDIITLENGDILITAITSSRVDRGLWRIPKTATGWGTPTKIGNFDLPSNADGGVQGLAYYDIDGDNVKEVIYTVSIENGGSYLQYFDNVPTNEGMMSGANLKRVPTSGNITQTYLEDATASDGSGCDAIIKVSGTKTWVNDTSENRPTSITVTLQQSTDGVAWLTYQATGYENPKVITEDANENWSWIFTDLPKFAPDRTPYKYRVVETPIPGYTTTYDGYNVVNTYVESEVTLYKVDGENGLPLAGAVFQLYKEILMTQPIGDPITTGTDGKIYLGYLATGEYWIKEISPPAGYSADPNPRRLVVLSNGAVELGNAVGVNIPNYKDKPTEIGLKKVDENLDALSGASFKISKDGGGYDASTGAYVPYEDPNSGITDRHGIFRDLTEGTYRIWEEKSPTGYLKINAYYTFEVVKIKETPESENYIHSISWIRVHDGPGDVTGTLIYDTDPTTTIPPQDPPDILMLNHLGTQIIGIQVVNEPNSIELTKTDGAGIGLPGALFGIYRIDEVIGKPYRLKDGTTVMLRPALDLTTGLPVQAVSGDGGSVVFEKIPVGLIPDGPLYIIEEEAPPGYVKSEYPIGPFYMTENGLDGTLGLVNGDPETIVVNELPISVTVNKVWIGGPPEIESQIQFILLSKPKNDPNAPYTMVPGSLAIITTGPDNQSYTWENLDPAYEYTVVEIPNIPGYDAGEAILLTQTETGYVFEVQNQKLYSIDLLKMGVPEIPILGARFKLTRTDVVPEEIIYQELEVNPDTGRVTLENLHPGNYTLIETMAPQGYQLDPREYKFTIDTQGNIVTDFPPDGNIMYFPVEMGNDEFHFMNHPNLYQFTLAKVDKDGIQMPNPLLQEVTFTLYKGDPRDLLNPGEPVPGYENVSADPVTKLFVFDGLLPGVSYYLKETKRASGYVLDPNYYEIKFDLNGQFTAPEDGPILFMDTNGQWSFKNFPVGEYPATGGTGTLPYTLLGLSLMGTAVIIGKKKRRGGARST